MFLSFIHALWNEKYIFIFHFSKTGNSRKIPNDGPIHASPAETKFLPQIWRGVGLSLKMKVKDGHESLSKILIEFWIIHRDRRNAKATNFSWYLFPSKHKTHVEWLLTERLCVSYEMANILRTMQKGLRMLAATITHTCRLLQETYTSAPPR
jgi:hypothetical protein